MNSAEAKAQKKQRQRDARKAKAEQDRAAARKAELDANPHKIDWSADIDFDNSDDLPKFDTSWKSTIDNLLRDESALEDVSTYLNLLEDTTMSRYEETHANSADVVPEVRVRVDPKSLSERAKRWGTTIWLAQWLIDAADYCKSPAGKRKLEDWANQMFGLAEARRRLQACEQGSITGKPAGKRTGLNKTLHAAALELRVSEEGLQTYHWFVSHKHIVQPPRTEPPVQRLPWEPSSLWLPRRHRSIVDGHQFPDVDWEEVRRTAISQYDLARDEREVWRTQPDIFFDAIAGRADSFAVENHFGKKGGPRAVADEKMKQSFRFGLHIGQLTYAHWRRAAKLVEDIARMGLTTSAEVEQTYQADPKLMFRLASCAATTDALFTYLWARLIQVMSNSEYYRPYIRRSVTAAGVALLQQNETYVKAHPLDRFDKFVVETCCSGVGNGNCCTFLESFDTLLKLNPEEIKKFDTITLRDISDVVISHDFLGDLAYSRFGQQLVKAVEAAETDGSHSIDFIYNEVGVLNKDRLRDDGGKRGIFCSATVAAVANFKTWIASSSAHKPHRKLLEAMMDRSVWDGAASDMVWDTADKILWEFATFYDPSDRPGSVAAAFGLYNPKDSTRPMNSPFYFPCLDPKNSPLTAESTPAPAFRDGVEDLEEKGVYKEFPKYKRPPAPLPTTFRLGKKSTKLMLKFLDDPEIDTNQTTQLRWRDLEKALKRLDFDVVQTPHLSLRFDPPAMSARPIIFYSRDIDAIISPNELKWISARLKRRYGFTAASFECTAQDSNE